MSDHDPLCQYKDRWNAGLSVGDVSGNCPGCSFIAKVRADERTTRNAKSDHLVRSLMLADLRTKVNSLWADPRERTVGSKVGYLRGYQKAINDVLTLIDGDNE